MTAAPPNLPLSEYTIELGDGRVLGVAEFGDPDGVPVLWFHATPGGCRQIPPDAPDAAAERGIRLIGMDRPGTGRSTPHMYHRLVEWADDVTDLADQLELDRFAVVGLSGGGPYVLACAHELPDRVIAAAVLGGIGPMRGPEQAPSHTRLLGPFAPILGLIAEPAGELVSMLVRPLVSVSSQVYDLFAKVAPLPDRPVLNRPEFKEAFLYDLSLAIPGGLRAPIHDLALFSRHWGFSLADIDVPVRFWHGDADIIVPVSHGHHQADLVPDSKLVVVPGGGHFSGYETVEEVFDELVGLWPQTAGTRSASKARGKGRTRSATRSATETR